MKKILNYKISAKWFVGVVVLVAVVLHAVSAYLTFYGIPTTHNEGIFQHQMEKLANAPEDITTIIIGDSSGGNAIHEDYYSKLIREKTLKLSLTSSFGLHGSLLMAEHALEKFPNLKNVIILQTFTLWEQEFDPQGYYLMKAGLKVNPLAGSSIAKEYDKEYFNWITTAKRLKWIYDYVNLYKYEYYLEKKYTDYARLYREYGFEKQYDIGPLTEAHFVPLTADIKDHNTEVLRIFSNFCAKHKLNCKLTNGPIHIRMINEHKPEIEKIVKWLVANTGSIKYYGYILPIAPQDIGDSVDHVITRRIIPYTKEYYKVLEEF